MNGSAPITGDAAATAREMWATRPPRRNADRKIAGVAGALARRYAVDPTLVRVGLVALALTGGGVLLYLLGWVVLPPDPADPPHRDRHLRGHRPRTGPPPPVLVLAVIVGFATLGPALGGRVQALVGLLVGAVLLYALHTGRSHLGEPGGGAPTGDVDETVGPPRTDPPAWDPLGAAPFAWDLPEPTPTKAGSPTRRSLVTPVTLALALLVGGAVGAMTLAGVPGFSMTVVWASALAVVGLGLLVAAFRGAGRGLLAAAVPLVVLTVLSATVGGLPGRFGDADDAGPAQGVGDVTAAPASAALVAPNYRTGLGDVDLDLRAVTTTPTAPVRTEVQTGVGDVTVTLATTADVTLSCRSGVGDVDCLGRGDGTAVDVGPDGPGGPAVDLTLASGAGDLEVRRG